jgi:hypothetical protein
LDGKKKQQLVEAVQRPFGGSLLLENEMPGRLAQPMPFRGIRKKSARHFLKVGGVLDLNGASGRRQPFRSVLEIPGVRTENDGGSISRRLDHVLPAAPPIETAADKSHVGQPPEGAQLADGINQDNWIM